MLPAVVPATLQLGAAHGNLPEALQTLSHLYEQQAEVRMSALPAILTPMLTIITAAVIAFVIIGMFAPFIVLIQTISGG
jgi:type II secretory pathway component PulF